MNEHSSHLLDLFLSIIIIACSYAESTSDESSSRKSYSDRRQIMFVRLTTDLVENVGSAVFANIEVLTLLTMPPDVVHHAPHMEHKGLM